MLAEIPYMIVWGFFSAMGWMGANWTIEKYFPDKSKEQTQVVQQEVKKEDKKEDKKEEQKTSP